MKVTIQKKNGAEVPEAYDFDQEEFRRLANDYGRYLKEGSPKIGLYRHMTGDVKVGTRRTHYFMLLFDEVAVIK